MIKNFEEKVKWFGVVDTRKYRYVYRDLIDHAYIERLPIAWLDTTKAIDGWTIVKRYR